MTNNNGLEIHLFYMHLCKKKRVIKWGIFEQQSFCQLLDKKLYNYRLYFVQG